MIKRIFLLFILNIFALFSILYCQTAQIPVERPPGSAPFNPGNLNLNYTVSGARATSLGGAFIGVADDATTATINPAGLTILKDAESSAHIRVNKFKIERIISSSIKLPNDKQKEQYDEKSDLSYGSMVVPYKKSTFALYWEVESNAAYRFETDQVPNLKTKVDFYQFIGYYPPQKTKLDFQITSAGIAAARYLAHHRLRIGLSFQLTTFSISYSEMQYVDFSQINSKSNDPVAKNDINVYSVKYLHDRDTQPGIKLGLLYKPIPNNNFRIGFVYCKRFNNFVIKSETFFPKVAVNDTITWEAGNENEQIKLKLPDYFGIGFYYEFTRRLRIATDFVFFKYSDILKRNLFNDLKKRNEIEIHVGAEYLLPPTKNNINYTIRAGFYTDLVKNRFSVPGNPEIRDITLSNILLKINNPDMHFAFGAGIGVKNVSSNFSVKISSSFREFEGIFSLGIRF